MVWCMAQERVNPAVAERSTQSLSIEGWGRVEEHILGEDSLQTRLEGSLLQDTKGRKGAIVWPLHATFERC